MKKGPIFSLNVFKDLSSVRSCFEVRFYVSDQSCIKPCIIQVAKMLLWSFSLNCVT